MFRKIERIDHSRDDFSSQKILTFTALICAEKRVAWRVSSALSEAHSFDTYEFSSYMWSPVGGCINVI